MVLHTKHLFCLVPNSFDRLVVEVDSVYRHLSRKGTGVHCETVVLRGNLNPSRLQILDGLVSAAMSELNNARELGFLAASLGRKP